MKVTAPADLCGRMANVENRLTMLARSLEGIAHAYDELGAPTRETLQAFADVLDEMREELVSIERVYVEQDNAALEDRERRGAAFQSRSPLAVVGPRQSDRE